MLQTIISIGISDKQPFYLQNRIRIANITCMIGVPIAITYLIFYALYFPPVLPAIITALFIILSTFLFNYLQLHHFGRFLLSVITPLLVSVIHGYAVIGSNAPMYGFLVFIFALTLIPWLILDIREYPIISLAVIVNFVVLLNQQLFIDILETDYPTTLFKQDFFILFLITSALLLSTILLFVLNYRTFLSEKANEKLVADLSIQNEALAKQQSILEEQLEAIEIQQQEAKIRAWQAKELDSLNQILRSTLEEKEILQNYLSQLVRTVKAQQGGIYTIQQKEETNEILLALRVVYASSIEKAKNAQFQLGEGLVGQCALDQKIIYLNEILQGQFKIESGLGASTPSSAIFIPLLFQGKLEGVLEVISFKNFEIYEKELLESACNNLAAWLFNQRTIQYTQNLLTIAQSQAALLSQNEEAMIREFEMLELKNKALAKQLEQYTKEQTTD